MNYSVKLTIKSDLVIDKLTKCIFIDGECATAYNYEIIVPNKVMKVYFADGTFEKMVLQEDDVWDLDTGIRIAIAKHVGRKNYNFTGIEHIAKELSYLKCIDKMIHKIHVTHKKFPLGEQKDVSETSKHTNKSKKTKKKLKITKHKHTVD